MEKAEFDMRELYSKDFLTIPETAYLLGGIPLPNVYKKLDKGQIDYVMVDNEYGNPVKRMPIESVFRYILKRRRKLQERYNRYRVPELKFIKSREKLLNVLNE